MNFIFTNFAQDTDKLIEQIKSKALSFTLKNFIKCSRSSKREYMKRMKLVLSLISKKPKYTQVTVQFLESGPKNYLSPSHKYTAIPNNVQIEV